MAPLSPTGQQIAQDLANRHNFSVDAVTNMLMAVNHGRGTMAQFSHPEFGGSGQWMAGGMTMIGDMFNNNLKYRVVSLAQDCASQLANHQNGVLTGSFQSQSQSGGSDHQQQTAGGGGGAVSNDLFAPDPRSNWWPSELGSPSASGSQNTTRYAYFSGPRRLAVATGDEVWVYDTQNHQIGGFSQQQSGDGSITFTSQFGTVSLGSLPVISRNGVPAPPQPAAPLPPPAPATLNNAAPANPAPSNPAPSNPDSGNVFDQIDRLGDLLSKGYVTQEEFDKKKSELLSRL